MATNKQIEFTKMHGLGNDYIYVDASRFRIDNPEQMAVEWSKPHTGIGSDGLILIEPSDVADFRMRMFNNDGSEGKMCGNGARCIGKYVYDYGLTDKTTVSLETLSGIKTLNLHVTDGHVETVTVDMGEYADELVDYDGTGPKPMHEQPVAVDGYTFVGTAISMGNPHFVVFVDDIKSIDLPTVGPRYERHPYFADGVNVEFVQVLGDGRLRMRVWERGSGITMACGTGACATAVAAWLTGRSGRESTVIMDGGPLHIAVDEATGHVMMTGSATKVFDGVIEI